MYEQDEFHAQLSLKKFDNLGARCMDGYVKNSVQASDSMTASL